MAAPREVCAAVGGGLFDGEGNLVGITTEKLVDEDVEGIGFAIPADWILDLL